jgi:hypothetical protein
VGPTCRRMCVVVLPAEPGGRTRGCALPLRFLYRGIDFVHSLSSHRTTSVPVPAATAVRSSYGQLWCKLSGQIQWRWDQIRQCLYRICQLSSVLAGRRSEATTTARGGRSQGRSRAFSAFGRTSTIPSTVSGAAGGHRAGGR